MRSVKSNRSRVTTRCHTLLKRTKTPDGVTLCTFPEDIERKDMLPVSSEEFTFKTLIDNKIPLKQNSRYIQHSILSLEESDAVKSNVDALRYLTQLKEALAKSQETVDTVSQVPPTSSAEPTKTE